jgi:hypothetical protein
VKSGHTSGIRTRSTFDRLSPRTGDGDGRPKHKGMGAAPASRPVSMTGVPATTDMHFRNGAVAISYVSTLLLQLVDEKKVSLDVPSTYWKPSAPARSCHPSSTRRS